MNIDLSDCGIFKIRVSSDYIAIYKWSWKVIYFKYKNGFEQWYDYDSNSNQIHSIDSIGYESWKEYNIQNTMVHKKEINI